MSKKALQLIHACLETQDPTLDLGNCGLTSEDFRRGSELDMTLRKCIHIKVLNFSDYWFEGRSSHKSKNRGRSNKFTEGPAAVAALENLVVLILAAPRHSDWQINDISFIGNPVNLTLLNLTGNKLTGLGTFHKFSKLEVLIVDDNLIENITGIEALPALRILRFGTNRLTDHSHIELPVFLQELYIHNNQITNLKWFKNNSTLKKVNLSYNQLTQISGIEQLSHLEELQLYNNQISDLSPLEKLISLKSLSLGKNKIADITSIGQLTGLHTLQLAYNNITDIRPLENLSGLRVLSLDGNPVNDLSSLRKLTGLQNLHLAGAVNFDAANIETLTNLHTLHITHTNFESTKSLEKCTKLHQLFLFETGLTDLKGIEHLTNLKVLNLGKNELTDISGLEKLSKLTTLILSGNKIKDISPLLPLLQRTKQPLKLSISEWWKFDEREINLEKNPIEIPPLSVIEQGTEAVLRYFKKIGDEGIDYLYEAKLTLVGEGSAGKTSLQKRLIKADASLPKNDSRTRGIKIVVWQYKGTQDQSHIIHIWDFGGQDVYYPVHRFFLTENSVFVLLASTRLTNHNFDYWIPTIFQFGGNSPVILGQTCHQGNKVPWNDIGHYLSNSNFNIIKTGPLPYTEINLMNNNEGLDDIKKIIVDQVERLPHFGKGVPKSWVPARKAIAKEADKHPCISWETFSNLCKATNEDKFATDIDVQDFARFLHALGIILWYGDIEDLQNWVILQPEWAMNAVYKIIDDDIIQERRGHILTDDFKRVWSEESYSQRRDILKKMLQIFKIAFPKKHNSYNYIIPARLLSIPKESIWQDDQPYLRLIYKYNFMPKGLVNQLSAHLSRYIESDDKVWNDAVNFTYEHNRARAQVLEDFYNRTISIKATGNDARGLMMIIRDAMQDMIDSYKGVQPSIIVPCSCPECKSSNMPSFFEYEKLMKWSATRKEVTCNESNTQLLIDELLYKVGLPNLHKHPKDRMIDEQRPLKAFISYSKFDGEMAKDGNNLLEEFKKRLTPLTEYNNIFITWDDTELIAGEEWNNTIKEELATSDIIFLLISPDFLNTKYIRETEIKIAIDRHNNKECIVVPIVLRRCGWTDIPMLSKLNGIPRKGIPIASWKENGQWHSIDDAWHQVYNEIKKLLQDYASKYNENEE